MRVFSQYLNCLNVADKKCVEASCTLSELLQQNHILDITITTPEQYTISGNEISIQWGNPHYSSSSEISTHKLMYLTF